MAVDQRVAQIWDTVRGVARLGWDVPKILPNGRCSPALLAEHWAEKLPDGLALACLDERISWSDLNSRANRYKAWFEKRGIGRGDVVALMMDNRPDFVFIVIALSKLGASSALINTKLTAQALTHGINVSGAKMVLVGSEHQGAVISVIPDLEAVAAPGELCVQVEAGDAPVAGAFAINEEVAAANGDHRSDSQPPRNSDVYCYIYTSGTTGLPKAAIIRNQRMLGAGITFGRLMHRCGPGDIIYVPLPLYHSSAMFLGLGAALGTGAAIALRRKFSASEFWKDVREFEATSFLYIGELCRYLLNAEPQAGDRDHRLRVGVGNGMAPDIWEPFQQRFGVETIREFYGSTEGNVMMMNLSGRPRMVGRMMPGQVLVRCEEETGELLRNESGFCEKVLPGGTGLLLGRLSPMVAFDGYVDREATNKKIVTDVFEAGDRYFNSGDLLQLHAGRWLSFADRVGDTFRWKGENVSTAEVSSILGEAEGVLEANVYGVKIPHAEGRAGMAALQVADAFSLDGFARFVSERLPGYQRPLFVRLLKAEMRVTGTFKHQKVDYRREGFDPNVISDRLYWFDGKAYVPLDELLYRQIETGERLIG
jgi:acyl-CoA synthetase (AMP-forming)/AMP-acid ligase II